MSELFRHVSGASAQKAEAIFDTIVSFETRTAVLDAAIVCENDLSDEEKEVWTALSGRLRNLHKKRHEVAHFEVSSPEDLVNGTRLAPFFAWEKERQRTTKYLTHDQTMARAESFTAAAMAVEWIHNVVQLKKLPPVPGAPPLQEPELIVRIRESLALTKAGQPPQPEVELE